MKLSLLDEQIEQLTAVIHSFLKKDNLNIFCCLCITRQVIKENFNKSWQFFSAKNINTLQNIFSTGISLWYVSVNRRIQHRASALFQNWGNGNIPCWIH
jgi:hypothetical protein